MKRALIIVCVVTAFLSISPSIAYEEQQKPQMTWLSVHWPPMMILKGKDAGQGTFDKIWKIWAKNMPEYEHQQLHMNWPRFWRDVALGKHICNPLALKTSEREKIAYFSIPSSIALNNSIIMNKADIEKLGNPETYSITKLVQDKRFTGAVEKVRSYTPPIDNIIDNDFEFSNINRGVENSNALIRLLIHKRINYFIEYPKVANYLVKEYNLQSSDIDSIRIEETPSFSLGYLACPKNAWGKKVIEDFNVMLAQVKGTKEYQELLLEWASPSERDQLKIFIKTQFMQSE